MSKGKCLCGTITWQIKGPPESAYHCHCKMCRKAHGAAFGTYYSISANNFSWIDGEDKVSEYASSQLLSRPFCGTCGSVVPGLDKGSDTYFVPAGSHVDGPAVEEHIFVGWKAPWYEITDSLKTHEEFPDGDNMPVIAEKSLPPGEEGVCRGSCLCGEVEFEITEQFKFVHNCHCSRCRQARAAAFTTNGFTSAEGVRFTKGESHVVTYKVPDARFFTHSFCDNCGSGLPRIDDGRKIAVIPLGALDDDAPGKPIDHIFVKDKADWFEITDDLPVFDGMPT